MLGGNVKPRTDLLVHTFFQCATSEHVQGLADQDVLTFCAPFKYSRVLRIINTVLLMDSSTEKVQGRAAHYDKWKGLTLNATSTGSKR